MAFLDGTGLAQVWDRINVLVEPKADKIPEVNHDTSDTTFTLTPNIMHIWGEVSSLTLSLPTDTNTVLDEYMFTFTCPSAAATTLTLPSTIKWIQEPNLTAGKTYQVSIINGLAGYLTDDMEIGGGDENVIEEIQVNGVSVPVEDKVASITTPQGTVTSVTVNGSNYTPDTNGLVNLGTISGGEGGTGGEYNVIEGVTFNGSSAPITNKIAAITYTAPTLSKGTTTGSGNAVTDITVSGHTVTLTKGTTFLTSYTETDPTVPAAVKAITSTDISNWNAKAADSNVVHLTGTEIITGDKTFTGVIYLEESSDNYIEDQQGYLVLNSETGVKVAGSDLEITDGGLSSYDQIEVPTIICTSTSDRASNKFFATDGTIQTLPTGSGGEANVIESVKVNGTALTVTNKTVDITAVPASIVTQDATHRFATDTEKSTWNGKQNAFSNASVLSGISSTDITNWNSKTDNAGTVTGVKINGTTKNPTSGVVDLGTVITSETALSKGTTSGSGNAVTDISVSGHTITLTKGSTFLTSHQDISGKADDSSVVHKAGDETITGDKTFNSGADTVFKGTVTLENFIDNQNPSDNSQGGGSLVLNSTQDRLFDPTDNIRCGEVDVYNVALYGENYDAQNTWLIYPDGTVECKTVKPTSGILASAPGNRANSKVWNTSGGITNLVTIYSGSSAPSNSLGSNGDIYIKTDISAGGEEE